MLLRRLSSLIFNLTSFKFESYSDWFWLNKLRALNLSNSKKTKKPSFISIDSISFLKLWPNEKYPFPSLFKNVTNFRFLIKYDGLVRLSI